MHYSTDPSEQTDGYYCHFTDGGTEAQRDQVTWLRSHSQWVVVTEPRPAGQTGEGIILITTSIAFALTMVQCDL